jgi:hypothetical protein
VLVIFLVLLLLVFMVFGAKESDIFEYMKSNVIVGWVLLGIIVAILVFAIGSAVGQGLAEKTTAGTELPAEEGSVATGNFEQDFWATIFHPKVLGMLILFGIAIFAVFLLSNYQ